MIRKIRAICVRCSTRFDVRQGSGTASHLLHCNRCGREKVVSIKDLSEFCRQSLSALLSSCAAPVPGRDSPDTMKLNVAPVDERRYRFMIEHRAGVCVCGSMFKFSGKARCPRCRSSVYRAEPAPLTAEPITR